jgi:hypothetical protein
MKNILGQKHILIKPSLTEKQPAAPVPLPVKERIS